MSLKTKSILGSVVIPMALGPTRALARAQESGGSMDDVARELANPTNALGKLGTNFDYTIYDGKLRAAADQSSSVLFFQPALPVPFDNGMNFFARPGIPVIFDQPVFNGFDFEGVGTDLGDIGYDLGYGGVVGEAGGAAALVALREPDGAALSLMPASGLGRRARMR